MDEQLKYSASNLQHNESILTKLRSVFSLSCGICAGILGFTGFEGF